VVAPPGDAPRAPVPGRSAEGVGSQAAGPNGSPSRALAPGAQTEPEAGGVTAPTTPGLAPEAHEAEAEADAWPYVPAGAVPGPSGEDIALRLVPYHRWGRSGPSTMRVWIPES
jgi:uncharacterized protein